MTTSAWAGPIVAFGRSASGSDTNPDRGPSMFDQGFALLDPRAVVGYTPGRERATGWMAASRLPLIDAAPSALAANNIAAAQVPVANTPLTLVSSSGAGITVSTSIVRIDTGATVTGLLAIDSAMDTVKFGSSENLRVWDPTKAISRNLRITSVGNDSGATFTVRGYDLYGQPMTETITGANAGIAAGVKAWKYIASITPAGTLSGSNVSVGTGDVFGLPLRADHWGDLTVFWNSALITAATGFTAAVTTDPATAITGDVRGTYAVQATASDGTRRLQLFLTPKPANLETVVGLLGVTQFSS